MGKLNKNKNQNDFPSSWVRTVLRRVRLGGGWEETLRVVPDNAEKDAVNEPGLRDGIP